MVKYKNIGTKEVLNMKDIAQAYAKNMPPQTRIVKKTLPPQTRTMRYADGRASKGHVPNPKCLNIYMSDRALAQIYSETQDKGKKETGGLLLGHFLENNWYIVESGDPGYNGIFSHAYHESDEKYVNHVCKILSRIYKHPLHFLGMWHRHPGSMDTFSGTDDGTNKKYAKSAGNGCISLLVNKDPDFRFTAYYVDDSCENSLAYTKTDIIFGDKHVSCRNINEIATQGDIDRR
jgi:hypothetical protein